MQQTLKKPTIVLESVLLQPSAVLYINDHTAISKQNSTIQKDFAVLMNFIDKHTLKPGKKMAFYLSYNNPISLEAAVEVDKIPEVLTEHIHSKTMDGGHAIVAHYTGPYQEMGIAYNAITSKMNDDNQQPKGFPFEVYINDVATVKNMMELQTDIYQMLQ
jgi:effector-binding domain-containing protein